MGMNKKRKVILITDGDSCAQRAIETAVKNIGGRCISRSGGNPTPISATEIIKLIKTAKYDPVVVMVDDEGNEEVGIGEKILCEIAKDDDIEIIGVLAVASNAKDVEGIHVDFSIDGDGNITQNAVDKYGNITSNKVLYGDTVDVINQCNIPIVVGIGDIGKDDGMNTSEIGAPIVTKALLEIMKKSK